MPTGEAMEIATSQLAGGLETARAVVGAAAPGLGVVIAARAPATVGELYADPVAHALEGVGLAARGTAFDVVFHEQCGTVREALSLIHI